MPPALRLAAAVTAAAALLLFANRRPQGETVRVHVHGRDRPAPTALAAADQTATLAVDSLSARRPYNMDTRRGLRDAAAVAADGELILTTSDWNGIGSAVNLAQQLARFSLDRRLLLLADQRRTCIRAQAVWPWLECAYSRGIPGFERYASTGVVEMWSLWSAKWLVLARLVEIGLNIMMMDSDMLVLADPYTLLRSEPLSHFGLILPPEGARVNVGYVYARGATARGGGVASLLWDVVRRLRVFLEQQTLTDRNGQPSVQGLWDQGLFSDALVSAVLGEHSYAFTWLHSPSAFSSGGLGWPPSGFTNANATELLAHIWRRRAELRIPSALPTTNLSPAALQRVYGQRPPTLFPTLPDTHPQRQGWSQKVLMMWNALRTLDPAGGIEKQRKISRPDLQPGWLHPAPWMQAARARSNGGGDGDGSELTLDLVAAAPDWLHCTTGHWMMTAGWLSADRPVCAILHLVECRSQFAHFSSLDTLKSNRPYVMRAFGHWHSAEADKHRTRSGEAPAPASVRAIRLGDDLLAKSAGSSGLGFLLNMLQMLGALAALTGRTPVVPSIPCSSRWLKRHAMTPNGVADDYVMQLPPTAAHPAVSCHLAIGGAKCALPTVLPAWLRLNADGATEQGALLPEKLPASRMTLLRDSGSTDATAAAASSAAAHSVWAPVDVLRARAFKLADVPMLEIRAADVLGGATEEILAALGAPTQPPAADALRGFECGAPVPVMEELSFSSDEASRLLDLRNACPAFFAARGERRPNLDWLHRRRVIRGDETRCANL